jgi:phosphatidylglycerol:prolipoprotein diacylglycerol transferase
MQDVYVHNLSPFVIQFTESLGIRWYGLSYLLGFLTSYLIADWLAKKNLILIPREKISDFITFGALGALIGGRVGYCLFYKPELLLSFTSSFPFWGVFEVHKGGMASHGGILGIMVGCYLFALREKLDPLHVIDTASFGGQWGVIYGRIANFINGELYGREAPLGTSWAVKFPTEVYSWKITDTDLMRKLGGAVDALGQYTIAQWNTFILEPSLHVRQIESSIYDIVEATHKNNKAVLEALRPILTARYPSQLIQAALEGFLVFIVLVIVWRVPRKPGVVSGVFGITYALTRIIGEQYRLPDSYIGFELFGLTRGQWLSIGLILIAFLYIGYSLRRDSKPVGGWYQKHLKNN